MSINKRSFLTFFVVLLVLCVHLFIVSPFILDYVQTSSSGKKIPVQPKKKKPAKVIMVPATFLSNTPQPPPTKNKPVIPMPPRPPAQKMAHQKKMTKAAPQATNTIAKAPERKQPKQKIKKAHKKNTAILAQSKPLTPKERVLKKGKLIEQPQEKKTTSKKPKLTLADLSKGFMHSVQQQRKEHAKNNGISGHGMHIACKRYEDKIWAAIEQAIRAHPKQLYSDQEIDVTTVLSITVDKGGSLLDTRLSNRVHIAAMNQYLLNKPQQVGLFPPVPDSLKQKTVTTHATFRIKLKKGLNALDFMLYAPHSL